MEEVVSGHTVEGYRSKQSGIKDLFPERMSEKVIEKEIRTAFKSSKHVGKPQFSPKDGYTRVPLQGQGIESVVEMWYNIDTKMIETAYPIDEKKVKIK